MSIKIQDLSPYVRHTAQKQDFVPQGIFIKTTPPFITNTVNFSCDKINDACQIYNNFTSSVCNKYNRVKHHLIDENGFYRISCVAFSTVGTSLVCRKVVPVSWRVQKLYNLQVRKLSPLFTTTAFVSAMLWNYNELTKTSFQNSKIYIKDGYHQYKINQKLAKIEADRQKQEQQEQEKKEKAEAASKSSAKAVIENDSKNQVVILDEAVTEKDEKAIKEFGGDPGQAEKEDADLYTTRSKSE